MSKTSKLFLLTVTLVIVLAMLNYWFGIFTPYNYFTAQWDKRFNKPQLLVYGKTRFSDAETAEIAKKFDFNMKTISGCMIESSLQNGADAYNNVMNGFLNEKLGANWKHKFDHCVDSIMRLQYRIYETLMSDAYIKKMMALKNFEFRPNQAKGECFLDININDTIKIDNLIMVKANLCFKVNAKRKWYVINRYYVHPYTLSKIEYRN